VNDFIGDRQCVTHHHACDCREQRFRELEARCAEYEHALALIACGKRPDGTYNRGREACERLARETLERAA
jgi:hypothetical protein